MPFACSFRTHPKSTIRIYQPLAAVDDVRRRSRAHAGAAEPERAAAVPRRLVARARDADRVPGRRRTTAWPTSRTPGERSGRSTCETVTSSGGTTSPHGKMAASPASGATSSSCTAWTGTSGCCAAPTGACSGTTHDRLAGRVLAGGRRRRSTSSAPGTGRSPRSTCARTACAGARTTAARSPRRRRSPDRRSTSATTAAGCLRCAPSTGALRWSRSVNGRVYGTPAVSAGRVFVPSSTGGSLTAFTTSGRYLWRRSTGSYVYSSPAVSAGRVFFGSYNGVFYALDARDRRDALGARDRRADLRRRGGRRRRRVRRLVRSPHRRRRRAQRPRPARLPARRVRARSRARGRRLLLHGYSRLYAVVHA